MSNRKGYSTGFTWIFMLIVLFSVGILFLIFTQVLDSYVKPIMEDQVNNSQYINDTIRSEIADDNAKWNAFWKFTPFIMLFAILIYVVSVSILGDSR